MITRRIFSNLMTSSVSSLMFAQSGHSQVNDFDNLLLQASLSGHLIENLASYRERQDFEYNNLFSKGISRRTKSDRKISESAQSLIIIFEVSGQQRYEQALKSVIWPHGNSGPTWGIGYDGGYVTKEWLHEDWDGYIQKQDIRELEASCGVRGERAKRVAQSLQHIIIPWETALRQFKNITLPRYIDEVLFTLPNAQKLNDNQLGALVSLVFNRGSSFGLKGDRYREMREIKALMTLQDFDRIPHQILEMRRIWRGNDKMSGLLKRRELEALLFQKV